MHNHVKHLKSEFVMWDTLDQGDTVESVEGTESSYSGIVLEYISSFFSESSKDNYWYQLIRNNDGNFLILAYEEDSEKDYSYSLLITERAKVAIGNKIFSQDD